MTTVPSILIVDDELENFDVLEAMLMAKPYQLHYAANGVQALSFLQNYQPDLILLDVMMPDLDGIETCRRIKSNPHWQHIPIVMVTALNSKEDLVRCLNAGATDFLSKPVNSAELRARVHSMLRIKQQHDDLQNLLQVREEMVSMIVHDLKNPLCSIILHTEFLQLMTSLPEPCLRKVNRIAGSAQQLQIQIDSLLLIAKIEAGKIALDYAEVDLCMLCNEALNDFEVIATQKQLTLIRELPEPGGTIEVDVHLFRRILDNLLSNAIKFSDPDSPITLRAAYSETRGAVIQVLDEGPGISAAVKSRIFQKYEVGTLAEGVEQTGLGLAFVKMAIEAHGGEVEVTDNQPQGSIFTLYLKSDSASA